MIGGKMGCRPGLVNVESLENKGEQNRIQLLIETFVKKVRNLNNVCTDVTSALERFDSIIKAPLVRTSS
jgi:hypothetical protein